MKKSDLVINKMSDPEKIKILDEKYEKLCSFLETLKISHGDLVMLLDKVTMYFIVQWQEKDEYMKLSSWKYDYYKEKIEQSDEKQ